LFSGTKGSYLPQRQYKQKTTFKAVNKHSTTTTTKLDYHLREATTTTAAEATTTTAAQLSSGKFYFQNRLQRRQKNFSVLILEFEIVQPQNQRAT